MFMLHSLILIDNSLLNLHVTAISLVISAIMEWLDDHYVPQLEAEIASSEETAESSV